MDLVGSLVVALVAMWLAAGIAMRRFGLDHRTAPLAGFVVACAVTVVRTGLEGDDLVLSAYWGRRAARSGAAGPRPGPTA